jgi:hypothetical protein
MLVLSWDDAIRRFDASHAKSPVYGRIDRLDGIGQIDTIPANHAAHAAHAGEVTP